MSISEEVEKKAFLVEINKTLRYWILEMTTRAGSGHLTSSLSAVELMSTLMFSKEGFFRYDVNDPENSQNDRLIFSKGHASPLYYALWTASGAIDPEELMTFRKFESRLEGHPTRAFPFTEVPTGSLGQGLGVGMGMALGAKYLDKNTSRTFVLLGDSEIAEGSVWEAAQLASQYKQGNLMAIIDMNRLGQRGETMLGHDVATCAKRFEAFGWKVVEVDGHDMDDIAQAYKQMSESDDMPVCIVAKTLKGKGISFIEDENGWHGKVLSGQEYENAKIELGDVDTGVRGVLQRPQEVSSEKIKDEKEVLQDSVDHTYNRGDMMATRKVYGDALVVAARNNEKLVVLDAEVSNSTYAAGFQEVYADRFFEMYIAEQNMVSAAVGLARRGFVPFVSSFGAFLTRAFDQIRMAQYADVNMVIVGSHVGVSIGEDGASQMGLEDIAIFRSLLKSTVFYPSDAQSMIRLVELAAHNEGVTYIRTTRAQTPVLYDADEVFEIGGSKTLRSSDADRVTIVTAGVTLPEALKSADRLAHEEIQVRVIDLYSVKPVDVETLKKAVRETGVIITVEDHYPEGGVGAAVRESLALEQISIHSLAVHKIPKSGTPEELLKYEEIDEEAITRKIREIL